MKYLSLEHHGEVHASYQQMVKEQNIKRVFDLVRNGRCASRAELARSMSLSATTISTLVEELTRRELILETGFGCTALPGRRPMKLRLNRQGRQIAIFSLNRRGVRFDLLDLSCTVVESLFVEHPVGEEAAFAEAGENYAQIFEDILLNRSRQIVREKVIVIGVSFPGIYIEREQAFSVLTAMNVSFTEASMRAFERRMGIPLLLANVSMCLSYAEKKALDVSLSEGNEVRDLIFINICDGVGAGIISEGSVMTGPFSTAGEFGHIPVEADGRPCRCGSRGCLEQYASQNAILNGVKEACQAAGEPTPKCFAELDGIYERSPAARRVLDGVAEKLANGVLSLICVTGIRRIVVGGGAEILGRGFLERVRSCVSRCATLTDHLYLDYAHTVPEGDSVGLAHYFLDKGYSVL